MSLEYIELADNGSREQYRDVIQMARRKYMRFPLVMVNGEVVFHGSLDYYSLSAVIKRMLQQHNREA